VRAGDCRDRGIPVQDRLKAAILCLALAACTRLEPAPPSPDVRYEPSPPEIVRAMLELAAVGPGDAVYDLGCGDGRIVIEAALRYGARAVCVDIDPRRIAEARANARDAGVADRIRFVEEDLLRTDLREATVVTLFLSLDLNLKLRPKLERELPPGARIVSHWHRMGDWPPAREIGVQGPSRQHEVFLWLR
jgi:SAM-dependent methyltransferase